MPLSLSVPRDLLGSAATLCPQRTPRRWAQEQARKKFSEPASSRPLSPASEAALLMLRERKARRQQEWRASVAERAQQLTHLCRVRAAEALGVSLPIMRILTRDFGLVFGQANAEQLAQITHMAARGALINDMAGATGLDNHTVAALIRDQGIKRGPKVDLNAPL